MKKTKMLLLVTCLASSAALVCVTKQEMAKVGRGYRVRFINNTGGKIKASAKPAVGKAKSTIIPENGFGYVQFPGCIGRDAIKIEGLSGSIKGKNRYYSIPTRAMFKSMMDCRLGGIYLYVAKDKAGNIIFSKITNYKGKNIADAPVR